MWNIEITCLLTVIFSAIIVYREKPQKKVPRLIYRLSDLCVAKPSHTNVSDKTESEFYSSRLAHTIFLEIRKLATISEKILYNKELQGAVKSFVVKWNEVSIKNSLLQKDGEFMSDVNGLVSFLPSRRKWKTLFPLFKA